MNSEHFKILENRLKDEIQRNRDYAKECGEKGKEEQIKIANNYIEYHEEMIGYIKKLDKEIEQWKV